MSDSGDFHLHLISDSTGETLDVLARAALAPFQREIAVAVHLSVFVRTKHDLEAALAGVRENPGLIWFTIADPAFHAQIEDVCASLGVESAAVLDPLKAMLARFIGRPPSQRPGMQHRMTSDYFDRIAALDYAISHDDGAQESAKSNPAAGEPGTPMTGKLGQRLRRADVILTGISRTSKTPTCIYLAYRGIKAANVPLVPNREPPGELIAAMEAGIPVIGLTASPSRLVHVRSHRLESLGQPGTADYADIGRIRAEVADARLFFQRYHIPVIDVTRRSIEETAAEILAVLRSRKVAARLPEGGA